MAGCIPLDAMRQSTLECLYNQTCIDILAIQPDISRPKALNQSLTRFSIDSKIGDLFDQYLFVESWQNRSSYEDYFSACAPQQLSYSYRARPHFGKLLLLIIGASSALFTYFKLFTPILIKMKRPKKSTPSFSEQTSIELAIVRIPPKTFSKGRTFPEYLKTKIVFVH